MSQRIEDYAIIGNRRTAALIGKDGSIDWLCLPRFDSPACFAALVGDEDAGCWRIGPATPIRSVTRAYRDATLVLETTFVCDEGEVVVTDCMLLGSELPRLLREVRGIRGRVPMRLLYVVRFDYGSIVPWVRSVDEGLLAVAGPDALLLASDVELRAEGLSTVADFAVGAGERVTFELTYFPAQQALPPPRSASDAITETEATLREWAAKCDYDGPHRALVVRSLVTLLALTSGETGGIVAAPTTSLPELVGGVRNWDYRYCWLRDATFTLYAFLSAGYSDSAFAWRNWLLRAIAGSPSDLQIVYGINGKRRLPEIELPWLGGYEGSKPVRIGNGAHRQFQLDVYGEVVDLLFATHSFGIEPTDDEWQLFKAIVAVVERRWFEPDQGLWEMRGEPQHFTHSKVMAWVALDRAVKIVERYGFEGPVERWREVRAAIVRDVCARAFDAKRNAFVQAYDSDELDASALLIPVVGFLPADDPRVRGTIAAIEAELLRDGVVYRYTEGHGALSDGLPPGENAFLACSFWLVDNYVLVGRRDEAVALFARLLEICNDVGLLAEEYDPRARRQLGNFPQAFSHVGLINSAFNLWHEAPLTRTDGAATIGPTP
ncbi:MAG: glycoside hydrolase family 15 protein [Candidatus Eremiobacteraeota bacterium]|nr:glycoside hydrolase family 15 protein [Candidatus Eremiobacteraeota bacterium]